MGSVEHKGLLLIVLEKENFRSSQSAGPLDFAWQITVFLPPPSSAGALATARLGLYAERSGYRCILWRKGRWVKACFRVGENQHLHVVWWVTVGADAGVEVWRWP